jgi:Xaa-Pro aminopeptidase
MGMKWRSEHWLDYWVSPTKRSAMTDLVETPLDSSLVPHSVDFLARMQRVRSALAERAEQGRPALFLITDPTSIRWCTGFGGSTAWLVLSPSMIAIGTDGRYLERLEADLHNAALHELVEVFAAPTRAVMDQQMMASVNAAGKGAIVGVAGAQVSYQRWQELSVHLPLADEVDPIVDLRRIKDSAEIQRIERAARIADQALADTVKILGTHTLPTEVEFRMEIEYRMRQLGADGPSYDTIVACGPEHAARPHHEASSRRMRAGETLVIDVGALVDGYHSDMTRSFVLGEPSEEQTKMYDILLEAQMAGLAAAVPGTPCRNVDAACREVVGSYGLLDMYLHSTGHGVGLNIHENPYSAPTSTEELMVGDVVTVEPGLYRSGFGGLRIEDLILITEHGHRILTHTSKDSPCLPSPPTI